VSTRHAGATTLKSLEARIAGENMRSHCVLVGHANTGLYLALRAIAEHRGQGDVIVPTITCSSVVEVILQAGFDPVFADVDVPEATISVEAVRVLLGPRTRAILPIHIFGHAAPVAEIGALARAHGVAVIEDGAPATGGALQGRPIGSFGDFSLHSYGGTKIVTAGGGGALLTDDADAAAWIRAEARGLPPLVADPDRDLLASSHRNLTHGLVDLLRVQPNAPVAASYRGTLPRYRELYLHAVTEDSPLVEGIARGLDDLSANLAARREIALRYHEALSAFEPAVIVTHSWLRTGTVWRYTFLVRDAALTQSVTRALRAERVNASNHYWSAAQLFDDLHLPGSDYVSPRLLNLWVDRSTLAEDVDRTIATLRRTLAVAPRVQTGT
jgi:dTDP-4-amino-4,6-dideoxygalactose transaminase